MNAEKQRLQDCNEHGDHWDKWGPYLSERQWGTVREDYSYNGEAWEYLPHDHSRKRAYRWGEDGLAGFSDNEQLVCMGLALWNGKDPILKERLFGLTGYEGNHGEDVKELYYYLDGTPTHSYLKMLYKYPQREFPYEELQIENRKRGRDVPEYEIIDSHVFSDNNYFDVFVEYAKDGPEDILMKITVNNRGPRAAEITVIPQIWFRNTWTWDQSRSYLPSMQRVNTGQNEIKIIHPELGDYHAHFEDDAKLMFSDNDTAPPLAPEIKGKYYKDAFHEYIVNKNKKVINPAEIGTKVGGFQKLKILGKGEAVVRFRLTAGNRDINFEEFDSIFEQRKKEADEFYGDIQQFIEDEDDRNVQRQAFAGMIWSKQFYYFDIRQWLEGDPSHPTPPESRKYGRNHSWQHLYNKDIISMPDKWEYPWYAAWDLAFHCIPLALIDAEFAKQQLLLITKERYMHPNGQIPAYEWEFEDVNPPVHAWATWRVYQMDGKQTGKPDREFLERVFHKLLINFTWWVNRKDEDNRNVFQGGFLGLDNIGVFDRSSELPSGGRLDQADGTSWMAMYSLNMMRIALELSVENTVYEDIASKFFEHFLNIAEAMNNIGGKGVGLWDDEDSFYYDILHLPNGQEVPIKVRSLVGLTPLFAVETIEPELLKRLPGFAKRMDWIFENRPELAELVSHWFEPGRGNRRLLSLLRGHRMKSILKRMLDETEFLSDYGIRALSRYHKDNPYQLKYDGLSSHDFRVDYQPAESTSHMFGGNSNWRGPIWFPMNFLIIESLQKFHHYYGNDFKVEYPTNSGKYITIREVANELSKRLTRIFHKDEKGKRPVLGQYPRFQMDPHFKDHILFFEYFHGDNGRGAGAAHQTGWTGLIAKLLHVRGEE